MSQERPVLETGLYGIIANERGNASPLKQRQIHECATHRKYIFGAPILRLLFYQMLATLTLRCALYVSVCVRALSARK